MICKAHKFVDKTAETEPCDKEAKYGCLCWTHSRQISGTPLGFAFNRVRRIHLPALTDEEIQESVDLYTDEKGLPRLTLAHPLIYKESVLEFIQKEGRVDSQSVINYVHRLANNNDMSAAKVGAILRVLKAEGRITRKTGSIYGENGKQGSAFYEPHKVIS